MSEPHWVPREIAKCDEICLLKVHPHALGGFEIFHHDGFSAHGRTVHTGRDGGPEAVEDWLRSLHPERHVRE